jgi:transcription antitermination protein NusB
VSSGGDTAARTTRGGARRLALEVLYQADITSRTPSEVLDEWESAGRTFPRFARELLRGVEEHRVDIDRLIAPHVKGWTLERMAVVDRNVLRLASFELLHRPDVPAAAAISQAVEAAKELSTEESGKFVNGILGAIARDLAGGSS